ncbi:hypothetical protein LTR10_000816 [Elasticomyces elasticus]|nr:hypothetical protein LTR10_000816 [Elasticomyces elasticus]KAK4979938.1 hypothetical protein LTR42_000245 [Elasticomyces elasticus]
MAADLAQEYLERATDAERSILEFTAAGNALRDDYVVLKEEGIAAKVSYFDVIAGMQKELAKEKAKVVEEQEKVAELEKSMEDQKQSAAAALRNADFTDRVFRERIAVLEYHVARLEAEIDFG